MAQATMTQFQVNEMVREAQQAAEQAAKEFLKNELQGRDQFPCGFAWTNIYGVKGNTKLGKMLAAANVSKNSYERAFQLWNPSGLFVQNVDCLEAGARAAAEVFRRHGLEAYAGSRWD